MPTKPHNTTEAPTSSPSSPLRGLLSPILRKKKHASETTPSPSLPPSSSRTSVDSQSTLTTATPCIPLKGSPTQSEQAYGTLPSTQGVPGSIGTTVPSLAKHSALSKLREEDSEPRKAAIAAYSLFRM